MNEVVKQILTGDTEAFCDIVGTFEKKIYSYLFRLCGSREDALDLSQDTFIKVYSNLHKFRIGMDFKPWIYRIAHNNFVNYIKAKKIHLDIEEEDFPDYITPEKIAIEKDNMKAIDTVIAGLPYMYKTVFLLRALDDISFREIGIILNIKESNARMRYLRVRKKISSALEGGDIL